MIKPLLEQPPTVRSTAPAAAGRWRAWFLAVGLFWVAFSAHAQQTQVIGSTTLPVVAPATSTYLVGPIYRSSATSTFNYSRYAYVYTGTELGLPAGSIITRLEWLKSDGNTISGNNRFQVLLNNTPQATLSSGTTWGAAKAGATPVYTSTTQTVTGAAGDYFGVTLTTPYAYTGGNLTVFTDWTQPVNTTATGALNFVTNLATGQAIGYADSGPLDDNTVLATASYGNRRPTLRITYVPATPCTAPPTAGTTISSISSGCSGALANLTLQGASFGTGMTYQWQQSSNGTTYTNIAGATLSSYSTPALQASTFFRAVLTCSGQSATSTPVQVTISTPAYATLPFTEAFDNDWVDACGVRDVPTNNWRSTPSLTDADASWRRHDDGAAGGWTNTGSYLYSPVSTNGGFSARFHSGSASAGTIGLLDLYVNMSQAGDKVLQFDYINTTGSDSLRVLVSTNGGQTFGPAVLAIHTTSGWSRQLVTIASTSATTVIRFRARADFGSTDIGMDDLSIRSANDCFPPSNLTATNVTASAATLNWSSVGTGTSFTVEYGRQGFIPGGPNGTRITGLTGTTTTISGLQPSTEYEFYVSRVCTNGSTLRTGPVSFFTRPANDECTTARVITAGATCSPTAGSVFQATNSQVGGACGTADDDVWYSFVATSTDHDIRVEEGTGFDASVQAFTGTCQFFNASLGCVDRTTSGGTEILSLSNLTVGQTYFVRVYSFTSTVPTSANSSFNICVVPGAPVPANDNCANATSLTVGATCSPINGTVFKSTDSGFQALQCSGTVTADDDVWYSFVATATAHDIRMTEGTGFNGVIEMFNGPCGAFTGGLGCANASSGSGIEILEATGLTVGQTYRFRVFSAGNVATSDANGNFTICVSLPAPAPANDNCATATSLTINASCTPTSGTTYKATASTGVPVCQATSPGTPDDDVWYSFVATAASHDILVDELPGLDAVVQVLSGACTSLTSLSCIDASAASGEERLRVPGLTVGQTYYVRVYSFASTAPTASNSNFTICVTPSPAPPANDECASAVTLPVLLGVNCTSPTAGTNAGASASAGVAAPTCGTYGSGGDVWYRVTVPPSGVLRLETSNGTSNPITDTDMAVYSGTCGSLTQISCNASGGSASHALINLTGRTAGEVLFVRVWENGNNQEGNFLICATSPTSCPEPSALTAINVTSTAATLTWAGNGTSYVVEYGPQGFTPGSAAGTRVTQTGQSLALTGLTANTQYCFYVTQVCSATANPSPLIGPECFTTTAAALTNDEPCGATVLPVATNSTCNPLSGSTVGATTTTPNGYQNPDCTTAASPRDVWFRMTAPAASVYLSTTGAAAGNVRVFTAATCSTSFTQVACRAAANTSQTVGQFQVTGLTAGQPCYVMVAGLTSGAAQGAFTICASTLIMSTPQAFTGELSIFPNPVRGGQLTLKLSGAGKETSGQVQLVNAIGQVVRDEAVAVRGGAAEHYIATQGLATGLYNLRLQVGGQVVVRKVVVE